VERKILWKLYGPGIVQGVWKLYRTPQLIEAIKSIIFKLLGYVIGMDETRVTIKTFEYKPEDRGNMEDSA
jgi:hypothetical protein